MLTTGRTVCHFHTRTKTGRAPQLVERAPEVWVELSAQDAASLGVGAGDLVVRTVCAWARRAPLRLTDNRRGRCSSRSTTATGTRTPPVRVPTRG